MVPPGRPGSGCCQRRAGVPARAGAWWPATWGVLLLRLAFAQLRFRPGRSLVLLAVLMATVACLALVGPPAKSEEVSVRGALNADSRAGYDLLVRPAGSDSAAERNGNLVSSTAMS